MKQPTILPMADRDQPQQPDRIYSYEEAVEQLRQDARRIERFAFRAQLIILIPGTAWIAWSVYVGLRAKGLVP